MSIIHLPCTTCNGVGFTITVMPATQRDPVRNVFRGCTICGGAGTKVTIPKECDVAKDVRTFYESGKGYKSGSGMVLVEYEHVAGDCAYCDGGKCEKCYQTGKNIRFIKQLPFNGRFVGYPEKILSFLLGALIAIGWYLWH